MKKSLIEKISYGFIVLMLVMPMAFIRAEEIDTEDVNDDSASQSIETEDEDVNDDNDSQETASELRQKAFEQAREAEKQRLEQIREAEKNRLEALKENRASTTLSREDRIENRAEIMGIKIERPLLRASTTVNRLENRENNIDRIRARIASTSLATTSTSTLRRMENLNDRWEKQKEQMEKMKERLLEKELKITEVLGKIADKIQERITILEGKGLNMTAAKAKLVEANAKIDELTTEAGVLAALIQTEITDQNQTQLFQEIRASQLEIRTLAFEAHALLVDTIKEITKVLPAKPNRATTTATSTN